MVLKVVRLSWLVCVGVCCVLVYVEGKCLRDAISRSMKGPSHVAANYRPISLLSQARKIIDSALDSYIRDQYRFNKAQLGFRKDKSTYLAILRAKNSMKNGHPFVAVLDLSAAYDRVPRDILIKRLNEKLPHDIVRIVEYLLKLSCVTSAGDETRTRCIVDRGVPQGSPLSPCLYNIFMDTFAEAVSRASGNISDSPVQLFADDVQLQAKHGCGMQKILNIATSWATENGMKWNTKPGKSEVQGAPKTLILPCGT